MSSRFFVSTHSSSGTAGRPSLDQPISCSSPHASLQRFSSMAAQQQRDAWMVWQADLTNNATSLYILRTTGTRYPLPMVTLTIFI